VIEYLVTPPARDELKRLSLLLRGTDQSLVKKYDPLFLALSLDDRFISENEFWQAIFEHPSLINGPVLASATKAALCKSKNAVKAFLAPTSSATASTVLRQRALPAGILRMIGASAMPTERARDAIQDKPRSATTDKATESSLKQKAAVQPKQRPVKKKKVVTVRPRKKTPTATKVKPKARARAGAKKSSTRGRKKK
jgi:arsenate reductase-like glutaredoxin family protein